MNKIISSDVVVAYSQCPRKAYLLLCTNQRGQTHEYMQILAAEKAANQQQHIEALHQKQLDVQPYAANGLSGKSDFLVEAELQAEGLEADCGLLVKTNGSSALGRYSYEPMIFTGTHTVAKEQKLELMFVGHVLGQMQKKQPATGRIISMSGRSSKVKLADSHKTLIPLLEPLQEWVEADTPEEPPVILNKHCPLCQFQRLCRAQAEQEDNLSLLDRVTPKVIRQYEKKGIFTVKQLSYLHKPRKRKKRARNPPKLMHKLELQALAIRTEKIYLQELPDLTRQPVELFLDIEGVPDRGIYYLMGLLVCAGETNTYHSFWTDNDQDEGQMWQDFLTRVNQYPEAPIYHYGSYEPRALAKLARRYETDSERLSKRLVNINNHIYGKVYFPVRSNSLKAIGKFIGTTWTAPNASGLQTLVWRHHWDETQNAKYRELLITYNQEDCQALKSLTGELSRIKHSANTLTEVDFVTQPKHHATEIGKQVHSQFKAILKLANGNYHQKKISFRLRDDGEKKVEEQNKKKKQSPKKGYPGQRKAKPKPTKIVQVPPRKVCPKHKNKLLRLTTKTCRRLVIDIVQIRNGLRKTITEYSSVYGYCSECNRYYLPPDIGKYYKSALFGRGFKAWVTYQRVSLRIPYKGIVTLLSEQFNENVATLTVVNSMRALAASYIETEERIIKKLLESPFIHADETPINIRGDTQYVWVFTDGQYVIFKLRQTREASIVHELLADYNGILISDFYPGYTSVKCRQQKCWVHLIRDLNNDLWANPFDIEFEVFISEVRNLIIPIMETVQKYGLKKRNLKKFGITIDEFYQNMILEKQYKSELVIRYQKRFLQHQSSLFTFLEADGIPWHNNTAESVIWQLAIQRRISNSFFESVTHDYLILLGIREACRLQGKSFFKFLFSGETDLDQFQISKRSRRV